LAIVLVISLLTSTTLQANSFRDVPENHFAHEAITWVSNPANGSFMVGDAANNFNPSRVMDVFEAAVTIAMAAGFKYSPASITPADQALFDLAYANHGALLRELSAQNPRWRNAANREIAFLLELNLLNPTDLDYFMVQGAGGVEVIASLSKEMATAFVIRLSGNQNIALSPTTPFRDEADINQLYRNYAYLGYSLGIVGSYDGHFTPLRHVTRAEFAQMLHHLRIVAPGAPGVSTQPTVTTQSTPSPSPTPVPTNTPVPSPQPTGNNHFAHTLHGIVAGVIPNTHIYITANDETHRHAFSTNPHIIIDNVQSTVTDVLAGMEVVAGFDHTNHIISMVGRVVPPGDNLPTPTPIATPIPTPVATPVPTSTPFATPTPFPTPQPGSTPIIQYLEGAEGIITGFFPATGTPTQITIRTARVDMHTGAILLEEYPYFVTPDTHFVMNGEFVPHTALQVDNVIFFEHWNSVLYTVYVLEPPITGVLSTVEGVLEAIFIDQHISTLILQSTDTRFLYILPEEVYNVYNLRRGMELRLYLDGREIYGLTQIGGTPAVTEEGASFVAYIRALRQGHTMVVENTQGSRYTLRVDGNTINTATDDVLNFRDLRTNMKLYVVILSDGSVRSVTILP